jgi:O-antigen ligase
LKKYWGEQLAALCILRGTTLVPSPQGPALFGVGLGVYQAKGNIQDGYSECISPVANQHLESDAQSGYLLMLVSAGIFGLAALLAVIGSYLAKAWRLARTCHGDPWAAALLGAMVAFAVMSLGTNLWIRGSFLVIAALFALLENSALLAPAKQGNDKR